jgi:RecA-family ATPase
MTAKLMPLDSIVRDRFAPVHWSQIHIAQKRDSLIESLLDAGGFSVAYGASGSRKTFFAIDLAGHVAMGWDWRGREVKQGAAVYIAVEGGGSGFNDRVTAFKHHHDVDTSSGQFFVIGESPDLCHDQTDVGLLIEQITKAVTGNVTLIVVDTLSRALAGGSKNASDDMGALVRHCDALRQATGAHLMLIHHTGKDDSKGARGHSLLKAAVDTEIEITATGQTSTATVTKQRDHPGGESMKFHLEVIEIGEDGREVGVVVPSDDGAMSPPRESKKQGI